MQYRCVRIARDSLGWSEVDDIGDGYKVINRGSSETAKGVAVAVSNRFRDSVMEVKRVTTA